MNMANLFKVDSKDARRNGRCRSGVFVINS